MKDKPIDSGMEPFYMEWFWTMNTERVPGMSGAWWIPMSKVWWHGEKVMHFPQDYLMIHWYIIHRMDQEYMEYQKEKDDAADSHRHSDKGSGQPPARTDRPGVGSAG